MGGYANTYNSVTSSSWAIRDPVTAWINALEVHPDA
jgi:hypothetical protein